MSKLQTTYRDVLNAASFAARAHQGQFRKDGKTPYASHPFRVALIVRCVFAIEDEDVIAAALLHDVLEDTTTDFDDLAEKFGVQVSQWAAALSKDKRLPEEEREAAYIGQLQQAPWQVHVCKLADIFDNLLDSSSMDQSRHAHVFQRVRSYLTALKDVLTPQAKRSWELAAQLFTELTGETL